MKIVYIAGPYRGATANETYKNIQTAREYAVKFWGLGFAVFCPHLNSAFMDGVTDDKIFLKAGLRFLRAADFIFMVPGWVKSQGAMAEYKEAMKLGVPEIGLFDNCAIVPGDIT